MNSLKEIWEALSERFKNPLLYSFLIAWLIINYKIPIVLLGDAKYLEKISFIEAYVNPVGTNNLAFLVYKPAFCAFAYVFILPAISLFSTYTTAFYERLHQNIRVSQAKKAILTKEQREKLEQEVAELNSLLRSQARNSEDKLNAAEAKMRIYIGQINSLSNTLWFNNLKNIAPNWEYVIKPPVGREIKGNQEQRDFVKNYGIPQTWAKVFEVIRSDGIRPEEICDPLNVKEIDAINILISLCSLNMLTPTWEGGSLYFKLVESSWVALLNGRPA